jgi:voltage-gated potassium channel Kch
MVLILAGMGVLAYIITSLARVVVEGEIRQALGKRTLAKHIQRLNDHYIICGFGRIGEIIARHLKERRVPLVIVENKPENLSRLEGSDYYFVAGDATREEALLEAGIDRARGLVAVVTSDADNVYIVLTARSLNANLFIVARAEEVGTEKKLLRAGADRVESPYEMGGRKMAHAILRPTVTTFMELALTEGVEWSMEEIKVGRLAPGGTGPQGLRPAPEAGPHPGGHQAGRWRNALQSHPGDRYPGGRHLDRLGEARQSGGAGRYGEMKPRQGAQIFAPCISTFPGGKP